jgi:hypothetical protein
LVSFWADSKLKINVDPGGLARVFSIPGNSGSFAENKNPNRNQ